MILEAIYEAVLKILLMVSDHREVRRLHFNIQKTFNNTKVVYRGRH